MATQIRAAFALCATVAACGTFEPTQTNHRQSPSAGSTQGNQEACQLIETPVTYEGTVKAILDSKCISCHSPSAPAGIRRPPYLQSYDNARRNADKILAAVSSDSPGSDPAMPPAGSQPLADGDETAIASWINSGLVQGAPPAPTATPAPTVAIAYSPEIKELLTLRCIACHGATANSPRLDSFAGAKAAATAALKSMRSQSMPPGNPLPTIEIEQFSLWIATNFPEVHGSAPEVNPATSEGCGATASAF